MTLEVTDNGDGIDDESRSLKPKYCWLLKAPGAQSYNLREFCICAVVSDEGWSTDVASREITLERNKGQF